jgi:hypothetical protein
MKARRDPRHTLVRTRDRRPTRLRHAQDHRKAAIRTTLGRLLADLEFPATRYEVAAALATHPMLRRVLGRLPPESRFSSCDAVASALGF